MREGGRDAHSLYSGPVLGSCGLYPPPPTGAGGLLLCGVASQNKLASWLVYLSCTSSASTKKMWIRPLLLSVILFMAPHSRIDLERSCIGLERNAIMIFKLSSQSVFRYFRFHAAVKLWVMGKLCIFIILYKSGSATSWHHRAQVMMLCRLLLPQSGNPSDDAKVYRVPPKLAASGTVTMLNSRRCFWSCSRKIWIKGSLHLH